MTQVGFYLNVQAPPDGADLGRVYREAFETVELAEQLGFDAVFLPEHHQQPDGYLPSPFVFAAALLSRTERIRVHTGIHLLPLWHPMHVAEDIAVLDVLSDSRFVPGVGLGLVEEEFAQFGLDRRDAVSRFEEAIEIMRMAWSGDPVRFAGRQFVIDGISVHPKPLSPPPIFVGAMSDRSVRRAGRIGDGWLTDPLHGFESLQRWASIYREEAAKSDRPDRIWVQRDCGIASDDGDVVEQWAPHLEADWRFYFELGLFSSGRFNPRAEKWISAVESPDELTFDRLRDRRVIAGTPDHVLNDLLQLDEQLMPEGLCFRFRFPHGPSHEWTMRAIQLFGETVLPALQAN